MVEHIEGFALPEKPRSKLFKVAALIAALFYLSLPLVTIFSPPSKRYTVIVTNAFDFPIYIGGTKVPPIRAKPVYVKVRSDGSRTVKVQTANGDILGNYDCKIEGEYCFIDCGP